MRETIIDFGLPAVIILGCFLLLFTGHDSEIKSILTLACGWVCKAGYTRIPTKKAGCDAPESKS